MALGPKLSELKKRIDETIPSKRTREQTQLLKELTDLDLGTAANESLSKSINSSVTRLTGPGGGVCSCCGKQF